MTVLLGLVGLMLFEFMVLRSVGIAGAIVLALAVSGACQCRSNTWRMCTAGMPGPLSST